VIGILVVSAIVSPYLLIPIAILAVLSVPLRRIYIRTARDIQRLDAVSRSPVYSHISSTVDGLTAVRAFGLEQRFIEQYYVYVNDSTAVRFLVLATGRAYSFCLDSFALTYIIAVNFFLMAIPDGLPGGDVGLVLSSVLVLIGLFQGCIRRTADFETQMVSCERVLEYGSLPSEAPLTNFSHEDNRVARNKLDEWPSEGSIKFKNVSVRYGDDPLAEPVLKNVTFNIKGGEKVGIVGRTGAGKSSLISILFRLVEPDGDVIIDNLDTQMLGLHELREKISIITQDPVLFSGTIRRNLDPFRQYADDQLWTALRDANLSKLADSDAKLESLVTEGGSNLSVGERQLLCLARALLKQNKILVLDEATANVDLETDELIQQTIKSKFLNCTVLTVAHRLNTIIDMDKVLVLDAGRVVEYDEPYLLLSGQSGHFHSMVKQTGEQYSQILFNAAKKAFYTKRELDMDKEVDLRDHV
jgi:ATP-binding cassette subfamily C (CFTR/MRP) protein 4